MNTKNFDQKYDEVFEKVRSHFPFEDYINAITYFHTKSIIKSIIRSVPPSAKDLRLLDIGCGPMEKTAIFSQLGFSCFSVDDLQDPWHRKDDNVTKILQFANKFGIDFHLQSRGDYSIPFEKRSFDIVTSIEVIEHLHASPKAFIEHAGEYLKPGGIIVFTTPNSVNLRKRLSVLLGKTNYPPIKQFYFSGKTWRGHVREYTLDELAWCLEEAGFQVVLKNTNEHFAHEKLRGFSKFAYLTLGSMNKHFRSGLIVIGKKKDL